VGPASWFLAKARNLSSSRFAGGEFREDAPHAPLTRREPLQWQALRPHLARTYRKRGCPLRPISQSAPTSGPTPTSLLQAVSYDDGGKRRWACVWQKAEGVAGDYSWGV
jgi:hypothetical protein